MDVSVRPLSSEVNVHTRFASQRQRFDVNMDA
jgi:hypothetical protein